MLRPCLTWLGWWSRGFERQEGDSERHQCSDECDGCLSDPEGFRLDYAAPGKIGGSTKDEYYTMRGSNSCEYVHPALHQSIPSNTCGPQKADCNVATRVHKWNTDQGIRRLGERDYCTYSHPILTMINAAAASVVGPDRVPYPDVTLPTVRVQGETLGTSSTSFLPKSRLDSSGDGSGSDTDSDSDDGNDSGRSRGGHARGSGGDGGASRAPSPHSSSMEGEGQWEEEGQDTAAVIKARGDGRCFFRCLLWALELHGIIPASQGVNVLQVSKL